MTSRRAYHREYYWRNVEKRRAQRLASKKGQCSEPQRPPRAVPNVGELLGAWR